MSGPLEIFLFTGKGTDLCWKAYRILLSDLKVIARELSKEVPSLKGEDIHVVISDTQAVRQLNKRFRNQDYETDVLAFPLEGSVLGEIWLCPPVIMRNAVQFGSGFDREMVRVLVHGILHLAGLDHAKPFQERNTLDERMFEVQERIVSSVCS